VVSDPVWRFHFSTGIRSELLGHAPKIRKNHSERIRETKKIQPEQRGKRNGRRRGEEKRAEKKQRPRPREKTL